MNLLKTILGFNTTTTGVPATTTNSAVTLSMMNDLATAPTND